MAHPRTVKRVRVERVRGLRCTSRLAAAKFRDSEDSFLNSYKKDFYKGSLRVQVPNYHILSKLVIYIATILNLST